MVKLLPATAEQDKERAGADRLLCAREIVADLFGGTVSDQWVKRIVAPDRRLRLGHSTLRWWRSDVQAWLAGHRDVRAAKPNDGPQ
jgi:predicted DNA-binding transcriptional regulator AlpA